MNLNEYYQQQAAQTFGKMLDKVKEKDEELETIFKLVSFHPTGRVRVAILGCGDKRYIPYHQRLLEDHLGQSVDMTTFDIEIEHLAGATGVVQHDCTKSLPDEPFDLTLSHVLLKFVEIDFQWDVIKNSYTVLKSGGLSIHIIDAPEITSGEVPVERWKQKLAEEKIKYTEVPLKFGLALVLQKL